MPAALAVGLLLVGVAGAVTRPFGAPSWAAPVAAAVVDLLTGAATPAQAHHSLGELSQPIAFLLAAVPLAVLLDRLGFFAAAAKVSTRRGQGLGGLWVLAAVVTTVLNLDASVVLLTPLYVRIARRRGTDPFAAGVQPLILAWLASSALPVSNLTNLIVASGTGAPATAFAVNLGLPSLAATVVGWLCYRRMAARRQPPHADGDTTVADSGALDASERSALRIGGALVAVVLIGFVLGRDVGIVEWEVALAADVVLIGVGRAWRALPWRSIPVGTALVAASLGVLATAAVAHVDVAALIGGDSVAGLARTAGVAALAANVVNNLPALLVLLPGFHRHAGASLWAALLGVNMGPVLVVTGTLASLLWLETLVRLDVPVRRRDVTVVGLGVGLPAAVAGLGVLLLLHAAGVAS
jgi:arsenical pump membrane protein